MNCRKKINIRKLQVDPVKPLAHKHSAIVGAVCLQVPPFAHELLEQTEAKEYFYIIKKNNFFLLLQSQRAPAKPVGQVHRIVVLLYTHVPLFKHTFKVHVNPISIGIKIIDYSFDKSPTTYLSNNHNFQNPVDMYI